LLHHKRKENARVFYTELPVVGDINLKFHMVCINSCASAPFLKNLAGEQGMTVLQSLLAFFMTALSE